MDIKGFTSFINGKKFNVYAIFLSKQKARIEARKRGLNFLYLTEHLRHSKYPDMCWAVAFIQKEEPKGFFEPPDYFYK
jgi:hypothetical protein